MSGIEFSGTGYETPATTPASETGAPPMESFQIDTGTADTYAMGNGSDTPRQEVPAYVTVDGSSALNHTVPEERPPAPGEGSDVPPTPPENPESGTSEGDIPRAFDIRQFEGLEFTPEAAAAAAVQYRQALDTVQLGYRDLADNVTVNADVIDGQFYPHEPATDTISRLELENHTAHGIVKITVENDTHIRFRTQEGDGHADYSYHITDDGGMYRAGIQRASIHEEDLYGAIPPAGMLPAQVLDQLRFEARHEALFQDEEQMDEPSLHLEYTPVGPAEVAYVLDTLRTAEPPQYAFNDLEDISRRRLATYATPFDHQSQQGAALFAQVVESRRAEHVALAGAEAGPMVFTTSTDPENDPVSMQVVAGYGPNGANAVVPRVDVSVRRNMTGDQLRAASPANAGFTAVQASVENGHTYIVAPNDTLRYMKTEIITDVDTGRILRSELYGPVNADVDEVRALNKFLSRRTPAIRE